jgi:hypothetical protein
MPGATSLICEVSIRLEKADRERFIAHDDPCIARQYGRQRSGFVFVPDGLLERLDEIRP